MPDALRARKATTADLRDLSQTLAAAFFDDPVFAWCYDDAVLRREIGPAFFAVATEAILPAEEIYTTASVVAGAVWVPPGVTTSSCSVRRRRGSREASDLS